MGSVLIRFSIRFMMAIERQTTMFTIYSLNDSAWDNGKASTNPKESNQKFYPNRDVHPL
jgi:hypothetical protein